MLSRTLPRSIPPSSRAASTSTLPLRAIPSKAALLAYQSRAQRKQQHLFRSLLAITFAGGVATLSQYYINDGKLIRSAHAEGPATEEEKPSLVFEQSRKQDWAGLSKEENRDLISSQHHQVKRSWENPGVYAWGSNTGRVVAPDRPEESVVKTPRRIAFFDGKLLRDIKLDRRFGAAIDEQGNLLQWGTAYKADVREPEVTLKGKNLISLCISRDRIFGLGGNGKVYSVPVSAEDQSSGTKPGEASWIPFWTWRSPIAYRTLAPKDMSYTEKVTSIAGGLEHAILLTSKGRIFSIAAASDAFPSRGQLGVPGLTWSTRPEGALDLPHEITTLRGFNIAQIACGSHHTLALDKEGRVFSWGDNVSGQLGLPYNPESSIVDAPSLLPTQKLYTGSSQVPTITSIAAGGTNSYMTVDATRVASQTKSPTSTLTEAEQRERQREQRLLGQVTADTFAFGTGLNGQLANNRWTHIQPSPTKIPTLSGLFEYDEKTHRTVPIRLRSLNIGTTHACAVMDNITYTSASASEQGSAADTNWGADVVFWGGNEFFQLGTGRRNNVAVPTYLQPLDQEAEVRRAKKSSGGKEEHRFHITPRADVRLGLDGKGRRVSVEQRVECGDGVTVVYSGT